MDYLDLIIDEYKKRQQEEIEDNRPFLELPIPEYVDTSEEKESKEPKRVIIIEL